MVQLVVHLDDSYVLTFDSVPTCSSVKSQISSKESIPIEDLSLTFDGLSLNNDEIVPNYCSFVRVTLVNGVCGGKGGFGGMLKSLAKQKGKTKTTDFGACRDLNGRRLRHINDEILLNKWKSAKDKGQEFDVEEETATGIDLWYLSVPSWADGIKVDKRKRFLKPRLKTILCLDWIRARQDGAEPPPNAPDFWGCPRGARCEFAHGESELRGETLKQIQDERSQAKRDEADNKKGAYLGPMLRAEKDDDEVNDLVLAGLRAAKRAKINEKLQSQQQQHQKVEKIGDTSLSSSSSTDVVDEPPVVMDAANVLLITRGDDVIVDESSFVALGNSTFGTLYGPHCGVSNGAWYYEVEILSDGLMQIGWTLKNENGEVIEQTEGDGVGDSQYSWAYDGFRQLLWHRGESTAYGPESGYGWKRGDVVGCYVDINEKLKSAVMWFSLNGELLQKIDCKLTYSSNSNDDKAAVLFPALSLDKKEKVGINLGQATFRHYQPLLVDSNGQAKYKKYSPVWNAVPSDILVANGFVDDRSDAIEESEVVPLSVTNEPSSTKAKKEVEPENFFDVPLESTDYSEVSALEILGMNHLKAELTRRGLKSGGTLKERAERLFSVRGISVDKIDKKLLSKK